MEPRRPTQSRISGEIPAVRLCETGERHRAPDWVPTKRRETPYSTAILPGCVGHRQWFDPFPADCLEDFQNNHGMITTLVDNLADGTFQIRRRITENGSEVVPSEKGSPLIVPS